ncbi:hypothetical protein [Treponema sp. J25]|uniref:hypothetical protein n=1 Tax=Treponema sp. J25 TaxID=2094121 RepID=UPI00104FE969|nr:hypothetical protein [Treponema sp. J25]MCX7656483.1 hypothetical protein [Treponemataceae bacterium]TCW61765.1 hypothetical protein C5O22_05125 [Treponema sp. J25]
MLQVRLSLPVIMVLFFILALFNSLQGLVGPYSGILLFIPVSLVGGSLFQLFYTYAHFGFHQDFSTDHPVRGEPVRYSLVIHNEGFLPTTLIRYEFSYTGPGLETFFYEGLQGCILLPHENQKTEFTFYCQYRGVYSVGIRRLIFRDMLGIIELSYIAEPKIFYVYPEIHRLPSSIDTFFSSSGEQSVLYGGFTEEVGVFENLIPLRDGEGDRYIAWKRFASTGVPCRYQYGKASGRFLKIVLDQRPLSQGILSEERLLAEDGAISFIFSLLNHMIERGIPAELVLGNAETTYPIMERKDFDYLYQISTGISFTDPRFPFTAFTGDYTVLLVTLQSLWEEDPLIQVDLYTHIEQRVRSEKNTHCVLFSPPSLYSTYKMLAEKSKEALYPFRKNGVLQVVNSNLGPEGWKDIFDELEAF